MQMIYDKEKKLYKVQKGLNFTHVGNQKLKKKAENHDLNIFKANFAITRRERVTSHLSRAWQQSLISAHSSNFLLLQL